MAQLILDGCHAALKFKWIQHAFYNGISPGELNQLLAADDANRTVQVPTAALGCALQSQFWMPVMVPIFAEAIPLCLLLYRSHSLSLTKHRFILIHLVILLYILPVPACIRPSSDMSIHKPYKGRYRCCCRLNKCDFELRHPPCLCNNGTENMEVKNTTSLLARYSFNINKATCFGLLWGHHQVYKC